VKRVVADYPPKHDFEIITLKDDDYLVGAAVANDDDALVFVSSDGQLLQYSASSVRPQGRPAGGMAGMALGEGAGCIAFCVAKNQTDVVVTAAHSSQSLPGTDAGSVKLTPLSEFPPKGRATGGVRAHRFIRNEDSLYFASVTRTPLGVKDDGKPLNLPGEMGKRDGSGQPLEGRLTAVGEAPKAAEAN
jgi:DNA gyrase subunit A